MECMRKTTGDMGCPLGCSPFPRCLAQYLALVPRAHKAHSGRKVSNTPVRPVPNQFFLPHITCLTHHMFDTAMAPCLMTPKLIHATVPVPQPRAEGSMAFPLREARVLRQRGNPPPQRRTRGSMPGPFANNLMFTPLSVHTTHFNSPVVKR